MRVDCEGKAVVHILLFKALRFVEESIGRTVLATEISDEEKLKFFSCLKTKAHTELSCFV